MTLPATHPGILKTISFVRMKIPGMLTAFSKYFAQSREFKSRESAALFVRAETGPRTESFGITSIIAKARHNSGKPEENFPGKPLQLC